MKIILAIVTALAIAAGALAQTPGFTRGGSPLPFVTTVNSNHTFNIDRGGGLAPANLTFGSAARLFALENDKLIHNVRAYGANNGGSVDAWVGVEAAAAQLRASGGRLLFPDGTYKLTNGVYITGKTVSGPWNSLSGNVEISGTRLAKINYSGNSNAVEIVPGFRFTHLQDLHFVGTNSTRAAASSQVGVLWHGPTGIATCDDVSFQNFWAGMYLHDTTGFYARNIACWSNFVGTALGYKPDGVQISGRWDRNVYGVFMGMTNGAQNTVYDNKFDLHTSEGLATISGVFGYNEVGIIVSLGIAHITDVYFEGNSTSIQIGLNSANAYEATYNGSAGADPMVYLEYFDANGPNDIRIYRKATLFARGCSWGGSSIRLLNSSADQCTIESDTAVTVIKSGGASLTVNSNYRYQNGVLVPRSGMSFTNLTDIAIGSGLSYAGGVLSATGGGGGGGGTNSYWLEDVSGAPAAMRTNDTFVRHWLSAYWPLDEAGGVRRDVAGTNDLYEVGIVPGAAGRVSLSATNKGNANYLYAPDSPSLRYPGGPFTLGGWFKANSPTTFQVDLIHKTNEYRLYYTGAAAAVTPNRLRFDFGNASLLLPDSWSAVLPNGTETNKFVTVTWDGSQLAIQQSAGPVYTTNLSTSGGPIVPPTPGTGGLSIIRHSHATDGFAQADEVFFVQRALSSGERTAIYNSGNGSTQTIVKTRVLDFFGRDVAAHRFVVATNAAPTGVTVGTTAADRWFQFFDSEGNKWFVPAWTNN